MIVLIVGLPGAGKTTLALGLRDLWDGSITLNGDLARQDLCADLGWSHADRVEHARRLGAIARLLSDQGFNVIVDFVCPTRATRDAFGEADLIVWVNRPTDTAYEDTVRMWEPPLVCDFVFENDGPHHIVLYQFIKRMAPDFGWL